jgi:signal transduction histidine kinase
LNFLTRTPTDAAQAALEELARALLDYSAADQVFLYRAGEQPGQFDPALAFGSLSLHEKQAFRASQVDAASEQIVTLLAALPASPGGNYIPLTCAQASDFLPCLRAKSFGLFALKNRGLLLGLALVGWLDLPPPQPELQFRAAGIVARSMALEIDTARLYEQVHQQHQQAQVAQKTTHAILRHDHLSQILSLIAQETMRATNAQGCVLWLYDQDGCLQPAAQVGDNFPSLFEPATGGGSQPLQLLEQNEPFVLPSPCSQADAADCPLLVVVPLANGQQKLGFLELSQYQSYLQPRDLATASAFASQAAVAVELDLMYRRLQQAAVAEERARLSRDLHDSISQTLYAMTLYACAAQRRLAEGNQSAAESHLNALSAASREVLGEMRVLIYALRPQALENGGLQAVLEHRLQAVEARSGLAYSLDIQLDEPLPNEVEENLYHICLEALNNTVRHAQASQVWVSIKQDAHILQLTVKDDGSGFDPACQCAGGLGLKSIQERVERMGGLLTVDSVIGAGVTVSVEVQNGKD